MPGLPLALAAATVTAVALAGSSPVGAEPRTWAPAAAPVAWPEPAAAATIDTIRCAPRQKGTATEVALLDFRSAIGPTINTDAIYELLNRVSNDPRVGAIALRIDSAGGDSYVAKKLYDVLREVKSACGLPMESFIGRTGTSGGYWIALAADAIHADPVSTVGAVGVVSLYKNEKDKLDREGVRYTVVRTGERKWPLIPYLPVDEVDIRKVEKSLHLVLDEFVRAVETARKSKLKLERAALTTGEAWMGSEAEALGLIDHPESIDNASRRMLGASPTAYRRFDLAKAAGATPPPSPPAPMAPPQPPAIARN